MTAVPTAVRVYPLTRDQRMLHLGSSGLRLPVRWILLYKIVQRMLDSISWTKFGSPQSEVKLTNCSQTTNPLESE